MEKRKIKNSFSVPVLFRLLFRLSLKTLKLLAHALEQVLFLSCKQKLRIDFYYKKGVLHGQKRGVFSAFPPELEAVKT